MKTRNIVLIVALIVIAGVIFWLESQQTRITGPSPESDIIAENLTREQQNNVSGQEQTAQFDYPTQQDLQRIEQKSQKYDRAKELVDPGKFINTEPFNISSLIGKQIVLVDFWTYSCINCQRTLPYLNAWHEKYSDKGLTIIGVHTPEFKFEENFNNVKNAVERFNIAYPVVQDNEYKTWRAYNNRYWPRKYLIDVDGFIIYDHIGEGAYEETELKIQELLKERKEVLGIGEEVPEGTADVDADGPSFGRINSPEIYFGYKRGKEQIGNRQGYQPDEIVNYAITQAPKANKFYLEGEWKNNPENMELVSEKGSLIFKYNAKNVNLVAGSGSPAELTVVLDGIEKETITVQEETLYELIEGDDYGEHVLGINFNQGIKIYTFTFG
ncbi:redoxin domain-containing protein [Candidatus Woesearchaeota archaeon]|nr:redoxin domain-containing protein [Candidatus Woesearchaeota archaeon]